MAHQKSPPNNPMDDFDPELLSLLRTRMNTFVKWDIVRYFQTNPHAVETVPNLARLLGRGTRVLEPELEALVQDDVLLTQMLSGLRVYSLNDDPEIKETIDDFFAACEDREFRIKAIYHVIRGLR